MADFPLGAPAKSARQSGLIDPALKNLGAAIQLRPLVMSMLANVAGLGLVALVLHEFFHLVTLQALGGSGYITFGWDLGLTHFTDVSNHLWAVRLSGGLLTGAFLLLFFWRQEHSSHSRHNIGREMAAFSWALGHLAYAPIEMLNYSPTMEALAFGTGFSIAGVVYMMKLIELLPQPALTTAGGRGVLP